MAVTKTRKHPGRHSIGLVSRRTGLKPDVIRAWERRYRAIEPSRTPTNRRYYTDEQLERLTLLREATLAGRQIGQVAHLDTKELRELVAEDQAAMSRFPGLHIPTAEVTAESHLARCLSAIQGLDSQALQLQLERSSLELSQPRLLQEVLIPLVEAIGEQWEHGNLRVVHEHLATAVVRAFLANLQRTYVPSGTAPTIVITTPSRQFHELGALIVATTAASEGWKVLYLGPDLPSEEIAAIALLKGATAVALSIVYPSDDPFLGSDLKKLRRLMGDEIFLLAGGRSAKAYKEELGEISAHLVTDLDDLRKQLKKYRR